MNPENTHTIKLLPHLPAELVRQTETICKVSNVALVLENILRFLSDAECLSSASSNSYKDWDVKQKDSDNLLREFKLSSGTKRNRNDHLEDSSQSPKRPRLNALPSQSLDSNDLPIFTIHALSISSPIRKKVDITVHQKSIKFRPLTGKDDISIPLLSISRAFIVPTREKRNPHWTIILLTSDKIVAGRDSPQIIFGMDAVSVSPLNSTTYSADSAPNTELYDKGTKTLPIIRQFLSHIPVTVFEPSTDVFKSACTQLFGQPNAPGVMAYRGAKVGTLWFMKEGILWSEAKPCEFWPVEGLIGNSEGLRVLGAGTRTCSVFITRKSDASEMVTDSDDGLIEETEFSMVNNREKENIDQWIREHRHRFGKIQSPNLEAAHAKGDVRLTVAQQEGDSDASDEDFTVDSDADDGGSVSSSSTSSEENREAAENNSEDGEGEDESDEGEVREANHPLMSPEAIPRMSGAALDMVVGIMENMVNGGSDDEHDELDEM